MRVLRVLGHGELALTRVFSPSKSIPRTFHRPYLLRNATPPRPTASYTLFRMTSDSQSGPEWTARRVRETFLDYFIKNGHKFGMRIFLPLLQESLSSLTCEPLCSSFIVRCSILRSHFAFHECWNESVQVDLPRNRRPAV